MVHHPNALYEDGYVLESRNGDWDIASTGQLEAPVAKGVCHYLSATAVIELYGSCLDIHRLHMGGLEWALSSMYTLP